MNIKINVISTFKKTINAIFGFFLVANLISSCASISYVTDDDVYVSKNPSLGFGDEINDESSYENYRYKKEKNNFNSVYVRTNEFKLTNVYIGNMAYSPFGDRHYYNSFLISQSAFCYANWYSNSGYYHGMWVYNANDHNYGGNFSNHYYNEYYNSYYNNGFYIGNNGQTQTNLGNYIQGPRNSISGINAGRRMGSSFTGKKGLAINTGNPTTAYSGTTVNNGKRISGQTVNNSIEIKTETKNTNRKTVTTGTGLAKNGVRVSTNNNASVRREGTNTQTSTRVTNENSGTTTRNSGGNSGTTIKTGTSTRSGGSTGGSTGGTTGGTTGKRRN